MLPSALPRQIVTLPTAVQYVETIAERWNSLVGLAIGFLSEFLREIEESNP